VGRVGRALIGVDWVIMRSEVTAAAQGRESQLRGPSTCQYSTSSATGDPTRSGTTTGAGT